MSTLTLASLGGTTRRRLWLSGGLVATAVVLALSAGVGAVRIDPGQVFSVLLSQLGLPALWGFTEQQEAVILAIRLPRILLGAAVGAGLAVSGAMLQALLRNGLADPALIGVSSGAALGASLAIVALAGSLSALGVWAVPVCATVGALGCTALVYRLATRGRTTDAAMLLLAGIAINALAGAVIGLMLDLADEAQLRSLTGWTLGSLGGASWTGVAIAGGAALIGVPLALGLSVRLNALLLGSDPARHLGVDADKTARWVIVLSAVLVGFGTSFSGVVGFVGLVVPHLVRMTVGPDHRLVLPLSALAGAALLTAADLLARTLAAPRELPLGVITALVGAPFFLWLLTQQRGRA